MRKYKALITALLLAASALAHAMPELNTGALYDYLGAARATFTKRIHNLGDTTAFVKVEVAEIVYDPQGTPQEQPLDGMDRPLIASPTRLIIPPGSSRDVRVVYRGPRLVERYFRLRFVPVVPAAEDAFGLSPEEREQYRDALAARVGLLKAIGGVVLAGPQPAYFNTAVDQQSGQLRVVNKGNTTVVLEDFALCQPNAVCGQGQTVHVRPGHTFTHRADKGEGYSFTLIEGKERRRYRP